MSGRESKKDANNLAALRPEIAAQWDKVKNGSVTPEKVSPYSQLNHHRLKPVDYKATESRAQAKASSRQTESQLTELLK